MSLFKKPKKAVQHNSRRLFTSEVEIQVKIMNVDEEEQAEADIKQKKKEKKDKDKDKSSKPQKSSLLSFGDEGILFGLIRGD